MLAAMELRQLPAYMTTSPVFTKRGELDAEVDAPYRAANIAKLLESCEHKPQLVASRLPAMTAECWQTSTGADPP
jgi:hypothetical protein